MIATLERSLLAAADDDWVSFAELLYLVREARPEIGESFICDNAILVAEEFTKRGLWHAGDVTESGFLPWKLSPEDASQRMRDALQALGRTTLVGDVCWFAITEQGIAVYAKYEQKG